jgi:competence protein ComFB
VNVINLLEPVVEQMLEEQWGQLGVTCSCELCKIDCLALTLNALPPRYVTNQRGQTIQRAKLMEEQVHADILRELARAALIVSQKPSHDR